jgi:DASS family divalent anion:Na+ symporter
MFNAKTIFKIIGVIVAIGAAVFISQLDPPTGLTHKSMLGLGIFVACVVISIIDIIPDYICWMLMCTLWAATGCVPFSKAFGTFSSSTWWLVVGAMVLAAAVAQSGLLKRIALALMSRFPTSYKWQTISLLLTGCVVSPLIPSGTVKVSLLAPYTLSISDQLGFARRSNGASGLFCAMLISVMLMIPALLSATFINYVIIGLLGEAHAVSYPMWIAAAAPWIILTLVLGFFAIQWIYRVDSSTVTATNEKLVAERKELGPMSRDERITAIVLVLCLIFWVTERMHGISAATVTIIATAVLCISKVVDRKTFCSKVSWDAIIFLGCAVSMTTAFPAMGINKWIGTTVGPVLVPMLQQNIFLFIIGLSIIIYLVRIFMVSQTAFIALFGVILVPAALAANMHPWVLLFISFTACNVFLLKYQNVMYMPAVFSAQTAAGEDFVEHKKIAKFAAYYMVSNIVILCACVPFWKLIGWM